MRFFVDLTVDFLDELSAWTRRFLPPGVSCEGPRQLSALTGDAGFRRYYRVHSRPSLIAVYAPPHLENIPAFVAKDLALRSMDVNAPRIVAVDYVRGFILQEDFGDRLIASVVNAGNREALYGVAEATLIKIQQIPADNKVFPAYSAELLRAEMELFRQWFVDQLLSVKLGEDEHRLIDETLAFLVASALEQPQVVVHRDYHSRNLMVTGSGELGVIDFQDAVVGAFSYDLVSLWKDCYIRWPEDVVCKQALSFLVRACRSAGIDEPADDQLLRWFDLMGLQRHIKVLGIFARLWLRDGKSSYLEDLPLVLRYTLEVTGKYADLTDFNQWFVDRLEPLLPGQPWYKPWRSAGE